VRCDDERLADIIEAAEKISIRAGKGRQAFGYFEVDLDILCDVPTIDVPCQAGRPLPLNTLVGQGGCRLVRYRAKSTGCSVRRARVHLGFGRLPVSWQRHQSSIECRRYLNDQANYRLANSRKLGDRCIAGRELLEGGHVGPGSGPSAPAQTKRFDCPKCAIRMVAIHAYLI
jgi:hypothetical protein